MVSVLRVFVVPANRVAPAGEVRLEANATTKTQRSTKIMKNFNHHNTTKRQKKGELESWWVGAVTAHQKVCRFIEQIATRKRVTATNS